MKQAISASWLFTLVILFIFLFASFLSLSTNYAKAFKVKDEIISTIERENGFTLEANKHINKFLLQVQGKVLLKMILIKKLIIVL